MAWQHARYEAWVLRHAEAIKHADSVVQTALQFLPGRYGHNELLGEALSSVAALVNLYHDSVLTRTPAQAAQLKQSGTPLPTHLRRAVWVIQCVELLAEVAAEKHTSPATLRRTLLLVEVVKAALRLGILAATRRMLVDSDDLDAQEATGGAAAPPASRSDPLWQLRQLQLQRQGSSVVPGAVSPYQRLSRVRLAAEVLHVMRPVVYLALLPADRHAPTWRPWLTAAAMDMVALLLHGAVPHAHASSLTHAERDELVTRLGNMWLYLARPPLFERYIAPPLQRAARQLQHIPLVSSGVNYALDYVECLNDRYFYSAGS